MTAGEFSGSFSSDSAPEHSQPVTSIPHEPPVPLSERTIRRELKVTSSRSESNVKDKDNDINEFEFQPLVLSGELSFIIVLPHIGGHLVDQC